MYLNQVLAKLKEKSPKKSGQGWFKHDLPTSPILQKEALLPQKIEACDLPFFSNRTLGPLNGLNT